jgi:hypothetical protein
MRKTKLQNMADKQNPSVTAVGPRLTDIREGADYLKPKFLLRDFPDDIAHLEFLKACERCGIPHDKWPTFGRDKLLLQGPVGSRKGNPSLGMAAFPIAFTLPAFDLSLDDHRSWKLKANRAWREFQQREFGPYLKRCTRIRAHLMVPRKSMRFDGNKRDDSIPVEIRYELAVRRHRLGATWAELEALYKGIYRRDRIRKTVTQILHSVEL